MSGQSLGERINDLICSHQAQCEDLYDESPSGITLKSAKGTSGPKPSPPTPTTVNDLKSIPAEYKDLLQKPFFMACRDVKEAHYDAIAGIRVSLASSRSTEALKMAFNITIDTIKARIKEIYDEQKQVFSEFPDDKTDQLFTHWSTVMSHFTIYVRSVSKLAQESISFVMEQSSKILEECNTSGRQIEGLYEKELSW